MSAEDPQVVPRRARATSVPATGSVQSIWRRSTDRSAAHPSGFAHHGVAAVGEQVLVFDADGDELSVLDHDFRVTRSWRSGTVEAHGLAISQRRDEPTVWIADPGFKDVPAADGSYHTDVRGTGAVVGFTLDGRPSSRLDAPEHPAYASTRFAPTAIAVEDGSGEDGALWVADGYGADLVHRVAPSGRVLTTLHGADGVSFDCPHDILLDRRGTETRLYVTDRERSRLQSFTLDGTLVRTVDLGTARPASLATWGEFLLVADLRARILVLDQRDRLVDVLFGDDLATARPNWPNALDADGRTVRPPLRPFAFNSPHAITVTDAGHLFVSEWVIGGRISRIDLERAALGADPRRGG